MKRITPPQLIIFGYLIVISLGTFLLSLPVACNPQKYISFVDALFSATSAVCVTGLTVVDTGSVFSRFGQVIILILFQVGGLGVMTISSAIALFIGKKITLRGQIALQLGLDSDSEGIGLLVKRIILCVLAIECSAAIILFFLFGGLSNAQPLKTFFSACFHAVSAFCNAGFSLTYNSFSGYYSNTFILLLLFFLIVVGGIGFVVLQDISRWLFSKKRFKQVELQTKIVLITTGVLLLLGFLFYVIFEANYSMDQFSFKDKLTNSLFHSATCRTAGFNTISINEMHPVNQFFTILLMFIGASPGSTGGGIKTCTFMIVLFYIVSIFRDQKEVSVFKRTIPYRLVRDALLICMLALTWIVSVSILLQIFEKDKSFIAILFETVSAFSTVGLSFGITAFLTTLSKCVLILTMMIGRIGLLVLVLALIFKKSRPVYVFPEERIMIG
ncbi:TrkH family potassium uptake protein [Chlamydiota bacterium]